jgi:hypothetical protein
MASYGWNGFQNLKKKPLPGQRGTVESWQAAADWAKQRPFDSFQPYNPVPPTGSYDPAINSQVAAANRGYGDLTFDIERQRQRDTVDYGLAREDIFRAQGRGQQDLDIGLARGNEDLNQGLTRGNQDFDTAFGRGQEDYNSGVSALNRQYTQLGRQQGEQANRYGVTSRGIALMQAQKRAENQAIDRQPLDTGWQRQQQDIGTGRARLGEDTFNTRTRMYQDASLSSGRLGEDTQLGLGKLALGYGRGQEDLTTQQTRAGRENQAFGLDAEIQKTYQAQASGWNPPPRPSNEITLPDGTVARTKKQGGYVYTYDQTGKVISKRKA